MPPPARAVPEEVVEEILLRVPPHKPACLVRASVVSKPWHALISGARFRGRYRKFHGAPPMLGFLKSRPWDVWEREDPSPPFFSTTRFRARIPDDGWGHRDYAVWDCRHGRVLLGEKKAAPMKLAVWDPITGRRRELQEPSCMVVDHIDGQLAAAVLCAVSGCDHHACHDGPFRVVFFSLHFVNRANFAVQACVSLPKTCGELSKPLSEFHGGEWSEPSSRLPISTLGFIEPYPPVLVKDAIHFTLAYEHEYNDYNRYYNVVRLQILKYDLSSNCLSLIDAPLGAARHYGRSIILALEDGSLGFARIKRSHLHLWSRQMGSDGVVAWTRHRIINLDNIPPIKVPKKFVDLLGSVERNDIIFVYTKLGIYKINLKTLRRKKICEGDHCNALIPYRSFYTPGERVRSYDVAP